MLSSVQAPRQRPPARSTNRPTPHLRQQLLGYGARCHAPDRLSRRRAAAAGDGANAVLEVVRGIWAGVQADGGRR